VVVLVILAVSLGLALVMFEVHAASASQLSKISGNVGNTITVRPAGSSGFGGGGGGGGDSTPLPQAQVDQLSSLPHVTAVQETVSTSYTGSDLVSGISFTSSGTGWVNAIIFACNKMSRSIDAAAHLLSLSGPLNYSGG